LRYRRSNTANLKICYKKVRRVRYSLTLRTTRGIGGNTGKGYTILSDVGVGLLGHAFTLRKPPTDLKGQIAWGVQILIDDYAMPKDLDTAVELLTTPSEGDQTKNDEKCEK
jgi:hypothetical protein